jgi:hypothetical protein
MPIARQRLGKHIPELTRSTVEGHPLLGNDVFCAVVRPEASNNWRFIWKSEYFQWSVQSGEDDSVSDSDLWSVVTSCIEVQ